MFGVTPMLWSWCSFGVMSSRGVLRYRCMLKCYLSLFGKGAGPIVERVALIYKAWLGFAVINVHAASHERLYRGSRKLHAHGRSQN